MNNHERFEWFAIGFNVCLLACFYSYVALIHGEAENVAEILKRIEL